MNLLELAQAELTRSNADRKHPFRFFTLATHGDFPEIRTVVQRKFQTDWSILFYTDARTPKVQQIRINDKIAALFYHPKKKLQVRIRGLAKLFSEDSEHYQTEFEKVKQSRSAKDYLTQKAPGTALKDESEVLFGTEFHFLPILIEAQEIDVLQLGRESHERQFFIKKRGVWQMQKVVP